MANNKFTALPWQKEFFQWFRDICAVKNDYIVGSILARRQICHKSATLLLCMRWLLAHSRCRDYHWASPTYKQCRKQFDEFKGWWSQGYLNGYWKFNSSALTITGPFGSVLHFVSLQNADNIRGETSWGVIIDEAAFCKDDAIAVVQPFIDVKRGFLIYASTPFHKSGTFYDTFTTDGVTAFDWTKYDLSSFVSEDRLAYLKKTMPPSLFKTDILGLFLDDAESQLFGDLSQWGYSSLPDGFELSKSHVCVGIDWSNNLSNKDYTSACVLARFNGITYEIATLRYNSGLGPKDAVQAVHSFLARFLPYIKCIMSESNSMGMAMGQMLCDFSPRYRTILKNDNWSSKSKTEAISKLTLEIPNGVYRFTSDQLVKELSMYTQFVSKDGRSITFGNATRGGDNSDSYHDDTVASFAHAASAFRVGSYTLS